MSKTITQRRIFVDFDSPIGTLIAIANDQGIAALHMLGGKHGPAATDFGTRDPQAAQLRTLQMQMAEYFAGERIQFDLPLAAAGTAFQQQVWQALCKIPYGQTRSYGEQALAIDNAKAVRAVGAANGRNPIAIIVPCHRVVGSNGTLTGFGGGLDKKAFLLELERRHAGAGAGLGGERWQQESLPFG